MEKIMIVNTSSNQFRDSKTSTGLWLGELVHFYDCFNNNNYAIDIFNIKGGDTPIDPVSLNTFMLDRVTKKYYKDQHFMNLLKNAQSIAYANPKEYDVIYFTGGHGVMFDFPDNQFIQAAINEVYNHDSIYILAKPRRFIIRILIHKQNCLLIENTTTCNVVVFLYIYSSVIILIKDFK